jgi:thioredoxin-like negative regulator of GroEL
MTADPAQLAREAQTLRSEGRLHEAIEVYRRLAALAPASGVAEHNLAAALGDAGLWAEAEGRLRAAFAKGVNAPETWMVLGRALQALGRMDEADNAFCEAIRRRPGLYPAQRELAQMRWMLTGDIDHALSLLRETQRAHPGELALFVLEAQALDFAGRPTDGYALIRGVANSHAAPHLQVAASQMAIAVERFPEALVHAEAAFAALPGEMAASLTLVEALLANGLAERGLVAAERLVAAYPENQHAVALLATACRLVGDPRYRLLYNYADHVRVDWLDAPPGWTDRASYVHELSLALRTAHGYSAHPFHQSLRKGTQAVNLLTREEPALRALPTAIDGPVRRQIKALGEGDDPVRRRNRGGYAMQGLWSVKLFPGGHHVNHVHPAGWLSSACYVETVDRPEPEGWIRFGQPGVPTPTPLPAEHSVRPEPGMLVLFPSYMWHGTVPFGGDRERLSFAFDLGPAA